jgi:hypothetical protein
LEHDRERIAIADAHEMEIADRTPEASRIRVIAAGSTICR